MGSGEKMTIRHRDRNETLRKYHGDALSGEHGASARIIDSVSFRAVARGRAAAARSRARVNVESRASTGDDQVWQGGRTVGRMARVTWIAMIADVLRMPLAERRKIEAAVPLLRHARPFIGVGVEAVACKARLRRGHGALGTARNGGLFEEVAVL